MGLQIQALNARQGDAIWIRWGEGHQILIDMGTEGTGTSLAERFRRIPADRLAFDLLVITHVDSDHLGGVMTCLTEQTEPIPGLKFSDIWFNGWDHLHGRSVATATPELEPMGPAQGEEFSTWLGGQRWNAAFGGAPIVANPESPLSVDIEGLKITVIGPTQDRLKALIPTWREEVEIAIAKGNLKELPDHLEPMGRAPTVAPNLKNSEDLADLADENTTRDRSPSNGTSITLLLEWEEKVVLLTGDAFGDDVADGLAALGGPIPRHVDLVKLPHHGSRKNVTPRLIQAVECTTWLSSTDGSKHYHPDADAVARILKYAKRKPESPKLCLAFNVPSFYNGWWENDEWQQLFDYEVTSGDATDGLTVRFESTEPATID